MQYDASMKFAIEIHENFPRKPWEDKYTWFVLEEDAPIVRWSASPHGREYNHGEQPQSGYLVMGWANTRFASALAARRWARAYSRQKKESAKTTARPGFDRFEYEA